MFKKTHSGGSSTTHIYIIFSANAQNSRSMYGIALKEIITLIEVIVPGGTINEIRSS